MNVIEHAVEIAAPREVVWRALTEPKRMAQWLGEPSMNVEVSADWVLGGRVSLRGTLHGRFEAFGTVVAFEPPSRVSYTQLSSISRLPDVPESYSTLDFVLAEAGAGTRLTVRITGFPTETISKHLDFYWRGTLVVLRRFVESGGATARLS